MKSRYTAVAWGKLELGFWQFFERLKNLYKSSKTTIHNSQNRDFKSEMSTNIFFKFGNNGRNGRIKLVNAHKISRNLIWIRIWNSYFCVSAAVCGITCYIDWTQGLGPGCLLSACHEILAGFRLWNLDTKQIQKLKYQWPDNQKILKVTFHLFIGIII